MSNQSALDAEDALVKIKVLADAAAFLAGDLKHRETLMGLLDIIAETADTGIQKHD